ncbi:MAG: DUF819 family protein [Proteobacteria bacterium]|nr:DUF819 family protein [Pseudomonadota bacterium]
MEIAYTLIFFLLPAGMLYLAHHQNWARKVGVILLCYITGLLVGNMGLIPDAMAGVQQSVSDISVALALPMLLFTLDIRQWSKMAGKAILSMLFATTSVVTLATVLFYLVPGESVESRSHLAAMAVGTYTGGTPNLAAIKAGLDIPNSQYIMFHSLDTIIGGLYLLFMLTAGIPLFRFLLTKPVALDDIDNSPAHVFDEENYAPLFKRGNLPQVLQIVLLSAGVLLLSTGIAELAKLFFSLENTSALTIILLTVLGMSLSFSERVRGMVLSYKTGMYLIYVFCFAVATIASLDDLGRLSLTIVLFLTGTIFGSLLLHAVLCKLFGVDSDTFMVTSFSAICSPPLVPMLVKSMGNPSMLLSGMTTGIIGYALGNYLGISLALILQS